MAKQVKLADIAAKLNVSMVTVSKALSDQKGVSEEKRAEIKKIAYEMGYVSPSASKLRDEKKSFNIGVLVARRYFDQTQSFYWLMYQELATRALAKGCFTILEVVEEEDERKNNTPQILNNPNVNGIMIIGLTKKDYLKNLSQKSDLPITYLDFYDMDCPNAAVLTDNYFGMYQLTNYMCELGHKKIAYVGTLFSTNSITDRYFGYRKALLEKGIEVPGDYVLEDRSADTGKRAGGKYAFPKDMPTAFVCNCDVTALELINELKSKGYRVPEDISVAGFDNYVFPNVDNIKLTTYEVDVREMVRKAVKILYRKMSGEYVNKNIVVVEGKMVVGDTTAVHKG